MIIFSYFLNGLELIFKQLDFIDFTRSVGKI